MTTNEKLLRVREHMKLRNIDAYIILTNDPHTSEYPAEHYKFREYLSGFNGSAGTLVITEQYVGLWTDSRYWLQAAAQLRGSVVELFKMGQLNVPDYTTWLTQILPSGATVGIDGFTLSYEDYRNMKRQLELFHINLNINCDIATEVFVGRPTLPTKEIFQLDDRMEKSDGDSGVWEDNKDTRPLKIQRLRKIMLEQNISHYLVSELDSIAWLLGLRGDDVEYNPVFYAYLIATPEVINLYIDPHKVPVALSKQLEQDGVVISLYDHFEKNVSNISDSSVVYYDPQLMSARIVKAIPANVHRREGRSIIGDMKAIKSEAEISNMRDCHKRDGVALVRSLRWLDQNIRTKRITELDMAAHLLWERQNQPGFISESFGAIVAYGPNAAIVHYEPNIESNAVIEPQGLLLMDTGAQYADGTTDITRTIPVGPLTNEEMEDYTLVLKAHIALATAIFPYGTRGVHLDAIARQPLWQRERDYGHGTGHGVGYCLNVHEGPQRIAKNDNGVEIRPGMITSNEPGIYREGKYGIRTENLVLCTPNGNNIANGEYGNFLHFETISLCPISTRPLVMDMLTTSEIEWINAYNKTVRDTLTPLLTDKEDADWLAAATKTIE